MGGGEEARGGYPRRPETSWGADKRSFSLQGWEELGIGTPGFCPQVARLLLTLLVTLGAALSSVGGVRVRELDPGIEAGVG